MTPDPTSALIAACRELIQTMYPVIDVLERELSGEAGHGTQEASQLCVTGVLGSHEGPDVPGRSASPVV